MTQFFNINYAGKTALKPITQTTQKTEEYTSSNIYRENITHNDKRNNEVSFTPKHQSTEA